MNLLDLRTAEIVLAALPPHYMPFMLSAEEAQAVGRLIFPEYMLMLRNEGGAVEASVACELMGRGFMYSAIGALPQWLQDVWVLKCDSNLPHKELREQVAQRIFDVDDADKLAIRWWQLACGATPEEVIHDSIMGYSNAEQVSSEKKDLLDRLNRLEEA